MSEVVINGEQIPTHPLVAERMKKLEYHAAALADALDGYQESCGEGHPRPNYECTCCGGEEATLTAYRDFLAGK